MGASNTSIYLFVCLILSLHWTLGSCNTPIRQCAGKNYPLPLMVQMDECNELPCDLWKGGESSIAIQFVSTRNAISQLTAKVRLASLGMTIPYDLEESRANVCKNLLYGAYCPLDAGEDVTYQLLLSVAEQQPELPTTLEVTVLDAMNSSVVACFLTDTRVKKR
ncbi:uncharacterized protein LOC115625475 [Scaptodrosophila lebanonensis]|uniref:Uncharacterized protein LOC115625475 n=1 Tax=Drosophila lebanonensis TaxID=7225 RepID=A0A6J2TLK0_DROLE|nr:uncharacterized protein LOC115625475 [Scaptodrosophila lebanonensis]